MIPYAKTFCALAAATAAGLWLGINYMGMLIKPDALAGQAPAWVAQAEGMAWAAVVAVAVASVAWMALDYRQQQA